MTITFSNQTTTFPYERKALKAELKKHIGHKWETEHGLFEIKQENIDWIASKAQKSMFNENKSYIYNKAFADFLLEYKQESKDVFSDIRQWAKTRGLYEKGDVKTQYVKLMEESGELAQSIIKEDHDEFVDAIGDIVVVLTNLEIKKAIGTSLIIIAFKSILGFFLGDFLIMSIDWNFLVAFTTITIIGIFLGIYFAKFIDGNKLKKGFGYFVLGMAVFILITEFIIK